MSVMSDYDLTLLEVAGIMGEPDQEPEQSIEYKVDMAIRDAWLATGELGKLIADHPEAMKHVSTPRNEGDLWTIRNRASFLIDAIRAKHGERPLPPERPGLRIISGKGAA